MSKRSFGRRINDWLIEPAGETFRDGKWRFWFPTLIGLTALNAVMTAVIFGQDGAQKYIGSIVVLAGAVLCWLALGLLHYSDSEDRMLAIGVAALDSLSLLFVAAHFSFLLWCQGHLWTLRVAEERYRQDLATYNAQWTPVKESNDRIAATVERIAGIEKETERLRNDTAYWSRRNKVQPSKSGIKFEASLTPMEIPPPPKALSESSAEFLAKWDSWIRLAGFGELALSIVTLIFVRTRTATRNRISQAYQPIQAQYHGERAFVYLPDGRKRITQSTYDPAEVGTIVDADFGFPDEIDADVTEKRSPPRRENFTKKKETAKKHASFDSEGLKRLREALKDISFRLPGLSFKSYARGDAVWILMMRANQGTQETISSAKAKLEILNDAMTMPREAFRARLEKFLQGNGFEI